MGSGASNSNISVGEINPDIVRMAMPVYFIDEKLTEEDYELVSRTWLMILNDSAPEFISLRLSRSFPFETCANFFTHTFYARLFDIHPSARSLFADVEDQGKALIGIITFSLNALKSPNTLDEKLVQLTLKNSVEGVKAVEYGIAGEVLFWTLERVLGDHYNNLIEAAWLKTFCRLLRVMVPVAVRFEMRRPVKKIRSSFSVDNSSFSADDDSVTYCSSTQGSKCLLREA